MVIGGFPPEFFKVMQKEACVCVNGVNIYPFTTFNQLLDHVDTNKGILVAINAEKILHATDQTRDIINRNIGYCDGAGAVMALHRKGYYDVTKIPGCVLWLRIIANTYKSKTFYFVGGKQEVIDETIAKLNVDFPGINILGYRNGYINTEEERQALIDDVVGKQPDVVFVAMGSPKQELLMEEMAKRHPAIYQGLGGSYDVYTGHVKRAPEWWQNHNLEWLYRLINQPSRIKRQIHLFSFWWNVQLGKY